VKGRCLRDDVVDVAWALLGTTCLLSVRCALCGWLSGSLGQRRKPRSRFLKKFLGIS
jgi:hypothetical protein